MNCGFINGEDEIIREAFENEGLPQTVFVKKHRTYYMSNDHLRSDAVLIFLENYNETSVLAYEYLNELPDGYMIYLEYYKKHLGRFSKNLYFKWLVPAINYFDASRKFTPLYRKPMSYWAENCVKALDKTAGKNFIKWILVPVVFVLSLWIHWCRMMLSYFSCKLQKTQKKDLSVERKQKKA